MKEFKFLGFLLIIAVVVYFITYLTSSAADNKPGNRSLSKEHFANMVGVFPPFYFIVLDVFKLLFLIIQKPTKNSISLTNKRSARIPGSIYQSPNILKNPIKLTALS